MNSIRTGMCMWASITEGRLRGAASTCGLMASNTRASGIRGGSTDMASGREHKVILMWVNGKTHLPMDLVLKCHQTETNMRASGYIR